MNMGIVQDIMAILQEGYAMSSASPLDRVVASHVIEYFYRKGWMPPNEVAHLVKAAGGEIRVSKEQLEDSDPLLFSHNDFLTDTIVFRAREKE